MTELYIDGVAAVLGKDFNIQVKRENPLFTKNGEYTYDITLPLDNATNAELYGHLNRLNSTQAVSTNRRAVLVADNRVYCNGTEVITGWTEDTVSIQIASGNSELNWLIGADLQISFLDGMPVTPALTEAEVMRVTAASYPDVSYNLPPVYDRTNDAVINPYFADLRQSPGQYCVELDESGNPRDFYPQPYLCAYVRAVLEALNYTVEYLFLESTIYKDLLICHAVRSMKWKDYLPGWSVKDFLEQIELMFNATFLVDNRQRTVRVLSNNAFYAGQETVHVAAVEDTYEAERADEDDEPEAVEMMRCDVRYAFPSSAYWRGMDLTSEVTSEAKHRYISTSYNPDTSPTERFRAWFSEEENQDLAAIVTDRRSGLKAYLKEVREDPFGQGEKRPHWAYLDLFHRIEREDPEQSIELEMMPVEIGLGGSYRYLTLLNDGQEAWGSMSLEMAIPEDSEAQEDESGTGMTVDEILESSTDSSKDESSSGHGVIGLAFYELADINQSFYPSSSQTLNFPVSHTSPYLTSQASWYNGVFEVSSLGLTLSLDKLEELCWAGAYDIKQEDAIKISCHDPNLYDARFIFEIHHKRYVCREMEFTLDANGRKGAWTGTFYPIRISDTEADARWILTDGRWRDGGVWLDNGRWLDDPV